MTWNDLNSTTASLDFISSNPVVYHCHHFNLFLDQTVDDFYDPERGTRIRTAMARSACETLLQSLYRSLEKQHTHLLPPKRIELAQNLFKDFGHGRLFIYGDEEGGKVEGEYLHYGFAWREKYGRQVERRHPADAFAGGFAAAALQTAYEAKHPYAAKETDCIATGATKCKFELTKTERSEVDIHIPDVTTMEPFLTSFSPMAGAEEERIRQIEAGLRGFLAGVRGDQRGLVEAFGVFVTRHSANYYNGISYRMLADLTRTAPFLKESAEELLRESGHVCVFNTFGGILYSPEWEANFGRIEGGLNEVVSSCMAIARALGFGHWTIAELSENHLVVRAFTEYESPFCLANDWAPRSGNCYFLQGAALAIMRLYDAIDWQEKPALDQRLYLKLFKSEHPWKVTQTKSLANGDPYSEVIVSR